MTRLSRYALVFWSCALLLSTATKATVVETLNFEALVAQSSAIFTGEVVASRQEQEGALIYTILTIAPADTLKGAVPTMLELRFVGGEQGDLAVAVAGQFIPTAQSRGVFFVRDLATNMVNPLTGWYQGYFPFFTDEAGHDFLDLRQRLDLVVPGLDTNPLVGKMQGLHFADEAIAHKVPAHGVYSWADFRAALATEIKQPSQAQP